MTDHLELLPNARGPLTIAFWIWALFDVDGTSVYGDYDKNMRELVERGFNCVRIEFGAGFFLDTKGNERGPVDVHPMYGKFTRYVRQCTLNKAGRIDFRKKLVEFFRAADRYDISVILSNWYLLHTNWFVNDDLNREILDELPDERVIDYFAGEAIEAVNVLKKENLAHRIAFVELFNEFDGLNMVSGLNRADGGLAHELLRTRHEAGIARFKAVHPEIPAAYDFCWPWEPIRDLVPRNADVLDFHCYYMWNIYELFQNGLVEGKRTEPENIPEATARYLMPEKERFTVAEIFRESGNYFGRTGIDWGRRIMLYASIDRQKIPELEAALAAKLEAEKDFYISELKRALKPVLALRDDLLPGAAITMGEGVTYCCLPELQFEEHCDLYWKILEEQAAILRETGLAGTIIRTLSGVEDPGWVQRASEMRRINAIFTGKEIHAEKDHKTPR